ncbi:MAG: DNA recombination protein RmuC [Proteobacteria bacterium]|nr:DNA recombination protein RmuC [Pseudomonadota bacterium]MCL2307655.1 DNA recombination protein RmuC [Pseudomonadota bacterium]
MVTVISGLVLLLLVLVGYLTARTAGLARSQQKLLNELTESRTQLAALLAQSGQSERDLRQDLATQRGELSTLLLQQAQAAQQQSTAQFGMQQEQWSRFGTQVQQLTQVSEQKLEALRRALEQRLDVMRSDNAQKLDQMRATVDEKLQATLETRLGESFKQVADRLEQVYKGLGEMQTLAVGVGDLKRVLSNVKTRGGWGEVQLAALLSEMLTPQQYSENIETVPGSNARVEFAIRLPGRDPHQPCWLPIDAKFPLDHWQRLQTALENADLQAAEEARRALEIFLKTEAKKIQEKYVKPPYTTDFAVLFVPSEGLYAELMARPGLSDVLQRESRIMVAGPTNLMAMLNSLQMGFRTLAIEQRSSEVWKVLAAVKTEFQKFGQVLAKTREKLDQATKTIDAADVRTRAITRHLRGVEQMPEAEAARLLEAETAAVLLPDDSDEP